MGHHSSPADESRCPTCKLPVSGIATSPFESSRLLRKIIDSLDGSFVVPAAVLCIGIIAGSLEFLTHLAVARMPSRLAAHALVDATVIAVMAMLLASVLITWAKARRREVLVQIRTVADLNHHLRNALQIVRQVSYLPEDQRAQAVFESMDRIDKTLSRFFPN